ncbi:MAG: NUDIX hydrolase [Rhodanobacter sp.]
MHLGTPVQQIIDSLIDALRRYRDLWPAEAATVAQFEHFLATPEGIFERRHAHGHFTGSAWLVSADGQRVLLLHHRKLGRWLQPGGHAVGDADLAQVALREAGEETGVTGSRIEGGIFDIDRHRIPLRGTQADHWHYDVRHVVRAGADEHFTRNHESRALAWRPVRDVANDVTLDSSLRRMAGKWLARSA